MTRQYVECSVAQLVLSASSSNSCNSFVYSYIGINALIECIILYGVGHWDLFIHSSIVHLVTTSMADLAEWLSIIVFRFWTGINTNIGGAGGWQGLVPGGAGYRDTGGRGGKDGRYDANLTNCSGPYYIYFNYF